MYIYISIAAIAFILGFAFAALIFRARKNENALFTMLCEFKKSIDEYKNETNLNTKEIHDAIKSASDIAKTITTNQNLKGQFGQDCLEAVLQACYPNDNIHYFKQITTTNSDDKTIKPDFLVKLPNNKAILIDSKLNIEKYLEFQQCEDKDLKSIKKTEFIKDLNNTVNILSNKKYESAKEISQVDFILMYIPFEPVLTLIYTDSDFLSVVKNSVEKNIIIVGNSSVLTTIKLVKLLWAQDAQEKNIENIVEIAQNIYELVAQHSQSLYNIKTLIDENAAKFNKEYEKITNDSKLFKYAQQLREFGIQTSSKKIGKKISELEINSDFLV